MPDSFSFSVSSRGSPPKPGLRFSSSRLPKLMNTNLLLSRKPGVFCTSSTVMVPPLKIPTWENTSGLASVMAFVCIPPMERPAMARCLPSANVRKLLSTIGMMSLIRVFIKPSAQFLGGHDSPGAGRSCAVRWRGLSIVQLPLSMTIMKGLALPSAIRLSMIRPVLPCEGQPYSFSPPPCCK